MDEKLKNDAKRVMLVQQGGGGQLKAVTHIDKKGRIEVADPTERNITNLFNVNTQDSALEAFFKKFMQEAENPSHTGLSKVFIMTEDVLNKLIKINFDPRELEKHRVDPAVEFQELQNKRQGKAQEPEGGDAARKQSPAKEQGTGGDTTRSVPLYDTSKIDRGDLDRKGIRWEAIEPHLKAMSYGHKSNQLVEMNPRMESGERVQTKGRVSLAEQADGSIKVIPHYWKEKPDLNAPFHGVLLPDDVKANIETTRHGGRLVDLELTPGRKEPCYISRDPLTNDLEYMRAVDFPHKKDMKGTMLSDGDQVSISAGGKGLLEKFVTRAGYFRDGYIQVDAANRNYEFSYDGLDRNRYAQENREIYRRKQAEQMGVRQDASPKASSTDSFIHKSMGGVAVPEKTYELWKAAEADPARRAEVKAVYMKDMKLDGRDQPVSLWVKPNYELGKQQFYKWNPDYVRKTAQTVQPAAESRTQHAVNTEGKTVEAVKGVKEPLNPGQQRPTEGQQKKQSGNRQGQRPPAKRQYAARGKKPGGQKIS